MGLLYNKSEDPSRKPIQEAKVYLKKKGVKVVEKTGTNADEIKAAAEVLSESVDAVFTPVDNTVAASRALDLFNKIKCFKPRLLYGKLIHIIGS